MRAGLRTFAIALAMLLFAGAIDGTAVAASAGTLQKKLDRLVALGGPGALVRFRQGDTIWEGTAGVADLATRRPVEFGDAWRIASVTKIVTAVIVARLAHDGAIDLDLPIDHYLPGIVPLADKITVRQLLNHTSGIPDYTSSPLDPLQVSSKALQQSARRPRPAGGSLSVAVAMPRKVKPGANHDYSNTNYLILGLLIEKITGRSYREVVTTEVIASLGLKHTGFPDDQGRLPVAHLRGYLPSDGTAGPFSNRKKLIDVTEHSYFPGAEGGLYSNLEDISVMIDTLWARRIVDETSFLDMINGTVTEHEGRYRYGLGIMARPLSCDVIVYGHEGHDLGIVSQVFATRSNDKQLVLAVNSTFDAAAKLEDAVDDFVETAFCK